MKFGETEFGEIVIDETEIGHITQLTNGFWLNEVRRNTVVQIGNFGETGIGENGFKKTRFGETSISAKLGSAKRGSAKLDSVTGFGESRIGEIGNRDMTVDKTRFGE